MSCVLLSKYVGSRWGQDELATNELASSWQWAHARPWDLILSRCKSRRNQSTHFELCWSRHPTEKIDEQNIHYACDLSARFNWWSQISGGDLPTHMSWDLGCEICALWHRPPCLVKSFSVNRQVHLGFSCHQWVHKMQTSWNEKSEQYHCLFMERKCSWLLFHNVKRGFLSVNRPECNLFVWQSTGLKQRCRLTEWWSVHSKKAHSPLRISVDLAFLRVNRQ